MMWTLKICVISGFLLVFPGAFPGSAGSLNIAPDFQADDAIAAPESGPHSLVPVPPFFTRLAADGDAAQPLMLEQRQERQLEGYPIEAFFSAYSDAAQENRYRFSTLDELLDDEEDDEYWTYQEPEEIKKPKQTRWLKILQESVTYLIFAHAVRMTEEDTPGELSGPFFQDWFDSVGSFQWKWDDGDKVFTNYVAHPGQGSVFGYIYGLNNRRITYLHFGKSGAYWKFKCHQFLFSVVSTISFEIGPLSEASLGNVGLEDPGGHSIIDYVNTPVLGVFGVSVLEDMADHYINKRVERNHRIWGRVLRMVLCPTRSFTNIIGFRKPWIRPRDPDYSFDPK
jgi:hypothetical protein